MDNRNCRITECTDRVARVRDILVSRGVHYQEASEIANMRISPKKRVVDLPIFILPKDGVTDVENYFCEFAGYTDNHKVLFYVNKTGFKLFVVPY